MTDQQLPPPRKFAPAWLSPEDVAGWLRLDWALPDGTPETIDQATLVTICAMAEPYVERCRPEWRSTPAGGGSPVYSPDPETYQGAVMYAAREFRRRNTPAGIEVYGEGVTFVTRFDPDIDRALQTGAWARPVTA